MEKQYSFDDIMNIIRMLRSENGCPWDRKQTHESLKSCMIEETYEAIEAIDKKDYKNLCEELGDMILQVALHTVIAEEGQEFRIEDVINGVSSKMIYRHPHVFSEVKVKDEEDVLANWEELKKKEKEGSRNDTKGVFCAIPKALPALIRATKVQKEAAKLNFEFKDFNEALGLVHKRLEELINAKESEEIDYIEEEYGDLLFLVVYLSRFLQLNAENSLTNATNKFINRFVGIERLAAHKGKCLSDLSINEKSTLFGHEK
jgi:tetrapyrrole methylase family protein/MazG family protein